MRARLQKILAAAGVASRRHAEELLRGGRVAVNGRVARLGDSADPATDEIRLDGAPVAAQGVARPVYWIVHKPAGVLTTTRDPRGRRTVLDLLPPGLPRLFPVGRLDFDTEGLVLLTNDGDAAHALLHPSLGSEREYRVSARGRIGAAAFAQLAAGVMLDDGPTAPARVGPTRFDAAAGATRFALTLREGRKRQIRRALDALGHPVVRLVRVRMGPVRLGRLPPGGARPLAQAEIAALRRDARRRLGRHSSRQRAGSEPGQAPAAAGEIGSRAHSKSHNRRRND